MSSSESSDVEVVKKENKSTAKKDKKEKREKKEEDYLTLEEQRRLQSRKELAEKLKASMKK